MRYEISSFDICDDDDARAAKLSRLSGPVQGIPTEAWPRLHGHPMQHLFTVDLDGLELELPAARGARLLVVFGMALFEMDAGVADGIVMRWVTQQEVDRYPTSTPPDDYVPIGALPESAFDRTGVGLRFEQMDVESDPSPYESFLGGEPVWQEAGEPADRPAGAFVLQASSGLVSVTRQDAALYLFEGGAYIQREDDDDAPKPWSEAIAASQQLVLHDEPPDAGALTKWGGVPRGVPEAEWPEGKSHVLTFELARKDEEEDGDQVVALALFADLEADTDDDPGQSYEVVRISVADVDCSPEPPEGVSVLPEKRLEIRPFPAGASYFDLRLASYEGPRLAWRTPSSSPAIDEKEAGFQLTDELLPNVPSKGTVYFDAELCMAPAWQPEGPERAEGRQASPVAIVEGLAGTLYEEETGTGLVVGYQLVVGEQWSISFEQLEQLAAAVKQANEEHGLGWELIVPGDTATDRELEVSARVLLGRREAAMQACDDPVAVDQERVLEALAALPAVPEGYWETLRDAADGLEISEQPAVYLAAYGPLCTGELYFGRPLGSDDEDDASYQFVRCQDMEQQPSEAGVDGVEVASVELMEVAPIDFGAEAHAARVASVPAFDDATYYLVCRYD